MTNLPPPRWSTEPDTSDRLTRLAAAITDVLEDHPDTDENTRGVFVLRDEHSSTAAIWGYDGEPTTDPVYDLLRHTGNLLAACGVRLEAKGVSNGEEKEFRITQPPLVKDTGNVVRVILLAAPDGEKTGKVSKAVREAVEAATQDWPGSKVIIMVQDPAGGSALMYHGLEDEHMLAHALLGAFQQVIEREGGGMVLIPLSAVLGGGPN